MKRAENRITDDLGRTLILRGVNLGGSSKRPIDESGPPESVSFVGRPFPLNEAEEHFENLKKWGLTFIRLIITWEALEHSGPGIYDESYIGYLREILLIAEKKGISVLIDPHQDVWSRWTGGDGAPRWTLEKLGMDTDKLDAVGAAVTPMGRGERGWFLQQAFQRKAMIWPVNYSLYATATMFTLFFAGNTFAPEFKIDGERAQDWLQRRYLAALKHCFTRLLPCRAITAWGVMNEPHPGFIGYSNLYNLENAALAFGPVPSPFQAMLAASGHSVQVPVYVPWLKGWRVTGKETINPRKLSLFREGFSCPWKQAGVWTDEDDDPRLLEPEYFAELNGKSIRFTDDFLKPFLIRYIETMKEAKNSAEKPVLFFIEGVPHGENPHWSKKDPKNVVNAFHHYDGFTLYSKSFRPYFAVDPASGRIILGKKKTAALYSKKLAKAKTWARDNMNNMPNLLGEFGLPFDLNKRKAYKTGDYSLHEKALSLYYNAIDKNLLSSTIWNYTADNTNEDGDHWNDEDLSIVSGGKPRAEKGWLRPYPMATAGIPLKFSWDGKKLDFRFNANPEIKAPTEIFIPFRWFGENPAVSVKTAEEEPNHQETLLRSEYSAREQRLYIHNDGYSGEVDIAVLIAPKA